MYKVIQGTYHNEERGNYDSYGIQNQEKQILFEDICLNKEMVQEFVDKLNRNDIPGEDLVIYIDDFLAGY
ncbi:MAG: hypothetical protein IJA10_15715 [Lachnospiraceae bacterium]|nr:hypothetical protein [Lachnospiraceae bacterium]